MSVALREYQDKIVAETRAAIDAGQRSILLVAPTGSGKTVIAAELIKRAVAERQRVLFLAHRRELISQAATRLHANEIDAGIILAGHPARPGEPVQIASVQTIFARAVRSRAMDMPAADLVVVDEAHHSRADSYQRILEAFPDAIIIGLSATPCRGDGRGLGNIFGRMLCCPDVPELIALGHLVPSVCYAPSVPDIKGVKVSRGDYVEKQLAERMDKAELIGDIVTHWHRLAQQRRTVIFASGVAHSLHLRDEFMRAGIAAAHIDGSTPKGERDIILGRLTRGEITIISNAAVLIEGWDCPQASVCVLARPTKQHGLYRQMVGRVLRPAPGKCDALILDHAGAVFAHGLPDDPIQWTLSTDRRAENPKHTRRLSGVAGSRLTHCPQCSAIRLGGEACPMCGWQPARRGEAVEMREGELARVDRNGHRHVRGADAAELARWHSELVWIAEKRGYRRGWAAHKFRERFGSFPPWGSVKPLEPRPEVLAWVRSREIAFAKAKQRKAAAA